ncbi:MAG: serine hydroxymethyltransferase [Patescibacteria group bacterium]|nr:serine hydroxymethyltransferase [Patescibacteria group bacterium]
MKHDIDDNQVDTIIEHELRRQQDVLEMIPSENYVSPAVLNALGSVLTNKYAEGYPGRRYYGGCENIDEIETLAIERAKKLFSANFVNVQPHSGAPANMAVYFGLLEPGDIILGMDLSHGGHLTHGHPVTYTSKIFNFIRYKTASDGLLDYENIHELAVKHHPKMILVGYSAYSRDINFQKIHEIAEEIEAYTMADIAHIAGIIAAGEMANPVPLFDVVTTTTHKTLRGPRGGMIMSKDADVAKRIDKAVFPGLQGGPHENNIAAKAVAFHEALQPEFKTYIKQVLANAKVLEQEFKKSGIKICFGQTDNHLLLLDVTPLGLTGKQAETALDAAGITVNKNMIPDDPRSPMDPSGIRLGTPAITTRGMKEPEMKQIAEWIIQALKNHTNESELAKIKSQVKKLTSKFPIY